MNTNAKWLSRRRRMLVQVSGASVELDLGAFILQERLTERDILDCVVAASEGSTTEDDGVRTYLSRRGGGGAQSVTGMRTVPLPLSKPATPRPGPDRGLAGARARAASAVVAFLDMRLANGTVLRHARRADLLDSVRAWRGEADSALARAAFVERVAARLRDDETMVGGQLTESELAELHQQDCGAAA